MIGTCSASAKDPRLWVSRPVFFPLREGSPGSPVEILYAKLGSVVKAPFEQLDQVAKWLLPERGVLSPAAPHCRFGLFYKMQFLKQRLWLCKSTKSPAISKQLQICVPSQAVR